MNNYLDILLNALALLMREYEETESPQSIGLVSRVLEVIPNGKSAVMSIENDIVSSLKTIVSKTISTDPFYIDKNGLIQTLSTIFTDDTNHILKSFITGVSEELNKKQTKSRVKNIRQTLDEFYTVHKAQKMFAGASYQLRNEQGSIGNTKKYLERIMGDLEALTSGNRETDEAIVDEIDLSNRDDVMKVANTIEEHSSIGGKFVTGWNMLNDTLQGGFNPGEFVVVNALAHKYKTGFTLSLFMQTIFFNKPELDDPTKKRLGVWISFEDDIQNILQFMYLYIKKNETGVCPMTKNIDANEMADFVMKRVSEAGWNIKLLRVNPSDWTYRHLFNKAMEYMNGGYELKVLGIDYLNMLPTTGCIQGPHGVDIRDLYRRTRNYFSARQVLILTPAQLGPGAKQLLRNGVDDEDFAKTAAGKGLYSGSSQLDQEMDVSFIIHKVTNDGKSHLAVYLEKHRHPTTVDESEKFLILPFNGRGPITDDLGRDTITFRKWEDVDKNESNLF